MQDSSSKASRCSCGEDGLVGKALVTETQEPELGIPRTHIKSYNSNSGEVGIGGSLASQPKQLDRLQIQWETLSQKKVKINEAHTCKCISK